MSYTYANLSDVKELDRWCRSIISIVQKDVREYFTFDIRLIGSGERRLVTQDSEGHFDMDYNLILQRDKMGLIDTPKKIKDIFRDSFNNVLTQEVKDFKNASDSTSVLTVKIKFNNVVYCSFDVAIIIEADDGYFYRLTHDKVSNRYIWNRVKDSCDCMEKFLQLKKHGYWVDFKDRYLELKNFHLSRKDKIKSFSIFLETLNEFY